MPAMRHDRVAGLTLLAEYIGDAAAQRLRTAWGGCQIKVPRTQAGIWWERLAQTLGERDAAELCDAFGGETLYIPRNALEEREAIRQRVACMLADGMSYLQIARTLTFQVRYTERGLRKLMERRVKPARRADDPRQMSLLPEPDVLHAVWLRGNQVEESAADCAATLGS